MSFRKYSHEECRSGRWGRPTAGLFSLELMLAWETSRSAWSYQWPDVEACAHQTFSRDLFLWPPSCGSSCSRLWTPLLLANACSSWDRPPREASCPGLAWRSQYQLCIVHGACTLGSLQCRLNTARWCGLSSSRRKRRESRRFALCHRRAWPASGSRKCFWARAHYHI